MSAGPVLDSVASARAAIDGARSRSPHGARIDVHDVGVVRRGHVILDGVSFGVDPGRLVAVVGASGAGKSTLLDAVAGVRPPTTGRVAIDGVTDVTQRELVGYVPQDDLIHRDLPLAATLRYAARLRAPAGTSTDEIERSVERVLGQLDLVDRADVRVGDLSGGQRKRTSIAVELLTQPRALFLDEPTSGLDPITAAGLMRTLRALADTGTTVVLTTHNPADLQECDHVVTVADGRVDAAALPPAAALPADVVPQRRARTPRAIGTFAQGAVLAGRNVELLRRNRLTLAIMLAAPALVIAMFVMLFRPGAIEPAHVNATAAVSTTYWMAFAAFFFGLTFGLLQVCTEIAIVRREVFVGVRTSSYLGAKLTVLTPVLVVVDLAMVAVLRLLDRLPALDVTTFVQLTATLVLTSVAALALGLLTSAAVAEPAQATLALPMLCFPAVLFAGAVVPVASMDVGGRAMSWTVIARWSFEALGRELGLARLLAADGAGGETLLAEHAGAFDGGVAMHWVVLVGFAVASLVGASVVVRRRTASR